MSSLKLLRRKNIDQTFVWSVAQVPNSVRLSIAQNVDEALFPIVLEIVSLVRNIIQERLNDDLV